MKIYVSEKEKDFIDACLSETKCYEFVSEELQYEDSLRLISLEQHEAEIRKPLEDEIVKLNEFISRLISEKEPETAREITERHHREIMLGRQNKFLEEEVERLKKENKRLIKDNKLLDKTKYTAQQDDINFFVSEERQRVITELEEWVDKQPKAIYWLNYNESEKHLSAEDLKQKLNEMKGE